MAVIDPSWVEIQTGMYLSEHTRQIGGVTYTFREVYAADGYCMYNRDEPEEERTYYQYSALPIFWDTVEIINSYIACVPIQEGWEIVGGVDKPVTE